MAIRKKRIVIIGGSFAGLAAANAISRRYQVTVIDPKREFEWTPNIHEILSGVKMAGDVLLDRLTVIERLGHAFVQDRVGSIDTDAREVVTDSGERYAYDACIVAVGGMRDDQGIPGAAIHSVDFREAADAVDIEERLTALLTERNTVSVVIVGGGVSGVEAVGELLRRHRGDEALCISVIEREAEILPGLPAGLAMDIRERSAPHGVEWHTDATIRSIDESHVRLESGASLPADLVIWSAGLAPPAFLADAGLIPDGHTWVPARETLQTHSRPEIFLAGDCAELPSPLRKQAYFAIDMGEYAGYNVQHFLREKPLKEFRAAEKPLLIAFGDLDTYLVADDLVVASRYLAAAKEGVYQYYMTRISLALPASKLTQGVTSRIAGALKSLVLPEIRSCGVLSGLRDSRIVAGPGASARESAG